MLSKYSPGKVITRAQYIVEIICERRAKNLNIELEDQFWKKKEWAQYYQFQITVAHRLIKKYNDSALLSAVLHYDCRNITTLNDRRLIPVINRIIRKPLPKKIIELREKEESVGLQHKSNSILDKLDG